MIECHYNRLMPQITFFLRQQWQVNLSISQRLSISVSECLERSTLSVVSSIIPSFGLGSREFSTAE